jgi:hypothetical protein
MIALSAFIVIILINALAFSQDGKPDCVFLFALMAPVDIVYGLYFAGTSLARYEWVAGVAVAVIGIFCLFRAVTIGLGLYRAKRN